MPKQSTSLDNPALAAWHRSGRSFQQSGPGSRQINGGCTGYRRNYNNTGPTRLGGALRLLKSSADRYMQSGARRSLAHASDLTSDMHEGRRWRGRARARLASRRGECLNRRVTAVDAVAGDGGWKIFPRCARSVEVLTRAASHTAARSIFLHVKLLRSIKRSTHTLFKCSLLSYTTKCWFILRRESIAFDSFVSQTHEAAEFGFFFFSKTIHVLLPARFLQDDPYVTLENRTASYDSKINRVKKNKFWSNWESGSYKKKMEGKKNPKKRGL